MSKKLMSTLAVVGSLVFVVTAFAVEKPVGSQLPLNIQKLRQLPPAASQFIQVKPVVVEVNKAVGIVGKQMKIIVTVKSTDGLPVKRGDVMIKINGFPLQFFAAGTLGPVMIAGGVMTLPIPTDDNGILSIPIVPRPDQDNTIRMGVNTIEAEFIGKTAADTNKYMSGKATGTFSILKGVTKIITIDKNTLCLTYDGYPTSCQGLAQRSVIITSKGKQIANLMTEKHGEAKYNGRFVLSSQLDQYSSCQIIFQGDYFSLPTTLDRVPCWVKGGY